MHEAVARVMEELRRDAPHERARDAIAALSALDSSMSRCSTGQKGTSGSKVGTRSRKSPERERQ